MDFESHRFFVKFEETLSKHESNQKTRSKLHIFTSFCALATKAAANKRRKSINPSPVTKNNKPY